MLVLFRVDQGGGGSERRLAALHSDHYRQVSLYMSKCSDYIFIEVFICAFQLLSLVVAVGLHKVAAGTINYIRTLVTDNPLTDEGS